MRRMSRRWTIIVGSTAAATVLAISAQQWAAASGAKRLVERVGVTSAGVPAPGGGSFGALEFSGDGRFVVFQSAATNLISGDTNGRTDIFVRDRLTATTQRVSITNAGAEAPFGDSIDPWISA